MHLTGQRLGVRRAPRPGGGGVGTEQIGGQQLEALVELRRVDLPHAALGPRRATRRAGGPGPGVRPRPDPLLGEERRQPLPNHGVAVLAAAAGDVEDVVDPGAADAVDAAGAGAGDHLAFRGQGGVGDPPAVTDRTDSLVVGHPGPVQVHLVEVDLAGEVTQRTDLDARLMQMHEEVGDAPAFGDVGVRAGEQHRVVGVMGPRRPDLLPGHDPLVTVGFGSGGERRQIRPGARLAEQLTPALLVPHDRREKTAALRLGAVREQRGCAQVEPQRVQAAQVIRGEHGVDGPGDDRVDAQAPVLGRPRRHHETRVAEPRVPTLVVVTGSHPADRVDAPVVRGAPPRLRDVRLDPRAGDRGGVVRAGRGVDRHPGAHRPPKSGGRRSRSAARPSRKSAVREASSRAKASLAR